MMPAISAAIATSTASTSFGRKSPLKLRRGGTSHSTQNTIPISFIAWSLFLVMISFYFGVMVGMHSANVICYANNVALASPQRRQNVNDKDAKKQSRFPPATAEFLVGAALVDKKEFLDRFDTGIAQAAKPTQKNTQVYILYQHKKALPATSTAMTTTDGQLPLLSVEDATAHCQSLNVISTKPFAGNHQCTAIVGQYESYHIQRHMRIVDNQPVSTTLYNLTRVGRGMQVSGINDMKPPPQRSQDINFAQLVRYLSSIHDAKKELKPIVEALTGVAPYYQANLEDRPTIIVMVCNLGQVDLLINFCCTARTKGLDLSKILVFCTDEETLRIARDGLGLFAYYDARNFASVPSEEAETYGDPVFADIMFVKAIAVHLISQLGYNILFQDVDVVWNGNPLPYFETHYTDYDIILQDDGARSTRFAPYSGNSGVYFIRHNARTKYLLTCVIYIGDQMRRASSHQQALAIVLSEHAMQFGLKVKTMSGDLKFVMGGYQYHRDPAVMKDLVSGRIPSPLVFHMCWTENRDNKLNFLQQMGMWQVLDQCNTGIKAHAVLSNTAAPAKRRNAALLATACCAKEPLVTCHFSDKPSIIPCIDSPKIDPGGKPFW